MVRVGHRDFRCSTYLATFAFVVAIIVLIRTRAPSKSIPVKQRVVMASVKGADGAAAVTAVAHGAALRALSARLGTDVGSRPAPPHSPERTDLFISFATGLTAADVIKLARAFAHFAPASHIVLYVDARDVATLTAALLARGVPIGFVELIDASPLFGVDPMWTDVDKALRKRGIRNKGYRKACYIYIKRFYKVREYLQSNPGAHSRVIMADARDIMLQGDPFIQITDERGVYAFTEYRSFKDEPVFNQVWARECYGDEWLREVWENKIVCAGVVMGGASGLMMYLDAFVAEFDRVGPCTTSSDTAIHGRLLRKILPALTDGPKVHIEQSQHALSVHLPLPAKWNNAISIDANGTVRNSAGTAYLLVHLADRNKPLFAQYTKEWA
jgi:hypothetical protein